jgi:hypothetical protein
LKAFDYGRNKKNREKEGKNCDVEEFFERHQMRLIVVDFSAMDNAKLGSFSV